MNCCIFFFEILITRFCNSSEHPRKNHIDGQRTLVVMNGSITHRMDPAFTWMAGAPSPPARRSSWIISENKVSRGMIPPRRISTACSLYWNSVPQKLQISFNEAGSDKSSRTTHWNHDCKRSSCHGTFKLSHSIAFVQNRQSHNLSRGRVIQTSKRSFRDLDSGRLAWRFGRT